MALAQRAPIVLLAANGVSNMAIAERVEVSRPTVTGWQDRYLSRGLAALEDEPRPGRPRSIDLAEIVTASCSEARDGPNSYRTNAGAATLRTDINVRLFTLHSARDEGRRA